MAKDPSAHVKKSPGGGIALFFVGGLLAAAAFAPSTALSGSIGGFGARDVQFGAGALFALAGLVLAVRAWRSKPPPAAPVEAHVAFSTKTRHDAELRATYDWTPAQGIVRPEAQAHTIEEVSESDQIDLQILEIKQKIRKAKVMLGTNKLSDKAYGKYVSDLKAELAELEHARMKTELGRS